MIDFGMLGLPIGLNVNGWRNRLSELVSYYKHGMIGWIQLYMQPSSSGEFTEQDVDDFCETHSEAVNTKGEPLEVIIHAPHRGHNFYLTDGLTENNLDCIDTVAQIAERVMAKKVIFHAGSVPLKEHYGYELTQQYTSNIGALFSYMSQKFSSTEVLKNVNMEIENMPYSDQNRQVLFGRAFYELLSVPFNQLRKDYDFGFCLDFTHAAVSANNFIPNLDANAEAATREFYRELASSVHEIDVPVYEHAIQSFYKTIVTEFLEEAPGTIHISGCDLGDVKDRPRPLTDFNRLQLEVAAIYSLYLAKEKVPIILEVPAREFNRVDDYHNLTMGMRVLTQYQMMPPNDPKKAIDRLLSLGEYVSV